MSIANRENKYQPKFQLSSSNTLGDMLIFVTKIEDQKGDRFLHLLVENLTLAEIVQRAREAKFSKSKKIG